MADFTICAPEPFVVTSKVSGKAYELTRGIDMSAEQIAAIGPIVKADDEVKRAKLAKAFILELCPDLASEPLSDVGYARLFNALVSVDDEAGES